MTDKEIKIVVIGCGYVGLKFTQTLQSQFPPNTISITVIEKSDYLYHSVGVPRAFADKSYHSKLFIPLTNAFQGKGSKVNFIQGYVSKVMKNELEYYEIQENKLNKENSTTKLQFDYLVIATGSTYSGSAIKKSNEVQSKEYALQQINEIYENIKNASSILVVGGGAVGCEVAGEIASAYKDKKVTLIEGKDQLVGGQNLKDKFRIKLMEALKKHNVNVILGDRPTKHLESHVFEKQTVNTEKGQQIEADIQLLCGGTKISSEFLKSLDIDIFEPNGLIRVKPNLQLDHSDYSHIFVIGDTNNHPTPKLAFWGGEQGVFLAKNFYNLICKKNSNAFAPFQKIQVEAMILPMGPNGGVSQLPVMGGLVFGDCITKSLKAKDVFVTKTWASVNQKVPN